MEGNREWERWKELERERNEDEIQWNFLVSVFCKKSYLSNFCSKKILSWLYHFWVVNFCDFFYSLSLFFLSLLSLSILRWLLQTLLMSQNTQLEKMFTFMTRVSRSSWERFEIVSSSFNFLLPSILLSSSSIFLSSSSILLSSSSILLSSWCNIERKKRERRRRKERKVFHIVSWTKISDINILCNNQNVMSDHTTKIHRHTLVSFWYLWYILLPSLILSSSFFDTSFLIPSFAFFEVITFCAQSLSSSWWSNYIWIHFFLLICFSCFILFLNFWTQENEREGKKLIERERKKERRMRERKRREKRRKRERKKWCVPVGKKWVLLITLIMLTVK